MLEVLALADGDPDLAGLSGYLRDPDAAVRAAAAHGLHELVEVVEPDADLAKALHDALEVADPGVRAAVVDVLRALRLRSAETYSRVLADPDAAVRIGVARPLVSLDARRRAPRDWHSAGRRMA